VARLGHIVRIRDRGGNVSGFSASWLSLREPYDARARNPKVVAAVATALATLPSITIVDLACGTGATLRALAPHLEAPQNWKLVDNDLGLLLRAANACHPRAKVTTAAIDLARDLEAVLDGHLDLVTTSALLDLVSDTWLERLATEAAARKLPLYAALTYDGRVTFEPSDPFDAAIIAAVGVHQRRDQGFGPALGSDAAKRVVARLETVGYSVVQGTADWVLGPQDREMQTELLESWAGAARETGRLPLAEIGAWHARRRDAIERGLSSIRIGHLDVFADPTGLR
jgi:SAM-dependent methyltransferase